MVDLEFLTKKYFINIEDVPYKLKKGGEIFIKPILLKNAEVYDWAKQCIEIDKNSINNIDVIQSSYLGFLMDYCFEKDNETEIESQLKTLLNLCLNIEYAMFTKDKGKHCIVICDKDGNIKQIINNKEFDDISKIILFQNNPSYDDRYVNPEVKEMLTEYYKVKYKDINVPTMERKKGFVSSKIGKTFKELNELSYREFCVIYDELLAEDNYFIYKIVASNFQDTEINKTLHPLFEKKHDIYEELFTNTDVLANKGISGAEQLNALNMTK